MKIELEPEDWPDVFDDPEYCNSKCRFHEQEYQTPSWCILFGPIDGNNYHDFKHPSCKLAYMNAKNKQL